jgi:hypothetical protein
MEGWAAYLPAAHGVPLYDHAAAHEFSTAAPLLLRVPCAQAVYLSQRHSRALSAAGALTRLGLLRRSGSGGDGDARGFVVSHPLPHPHAHAPSALRVTVAGADRHEGVCDGALACAALFRALAEEVAARGGVSESAHHIARDDDAATPKKTVVTRLRLLLQGPAVSRAPRRAAETLVPARAARRSGAASKSSSDGDESSDDDAAPPWPRAAPPPPPPPARACALRLAFAHGLLCDPDASQRKNLEATNDNADADADADSAARPPHLVIAFNAGVWGYAGWAASIAAAARTLRAPVVVTAYSRQEAEDDEVRAGNRCGARAAHIFAQMSLFLNLFFF